jgi:hypothetical protein
VTLRQTQDPGYGKFVTEAQTQLIQGPSSLCSTADECMPFVGNGLCTNGAVVELPGAGLLLRHYLFERWYIYVRKVQLGADRHRYQPRLQLHNI